MDEQELWEVFNYACAIASQRSGIPMENICPSKEDYELAIQFHKVIDQLST